MRIGPCNIVIIHDGRSRKECNHSKGNVERRCQQTLCRLWGIRYLIKYMTFRYKMGLLEYWSLFMHSMRRLAPNPRHAHLQDQVDLIGQMDKGTDPVDAEQGKRPSQCHIQSASRTISVSFEFWVKYLNKLIYCCIQRSTAIYQGQV
jgi:hypothetical protein